uniref:Uncharacterized protein n=1 Tax=Neolamprologus brichardi TaxID=32507 RepID=A0A3Q4FXV7_NEOBR
MDFGPYLLAPCSFVCCSLFMIFFSLYLQLHTADLGGQGTTSEVVQSVMRVIQSKGQFTAEL